MIINRVISCILLTQISKAAVHVSVGDSDLVINSWHFVNSVGGYKQGAAWLLMYFIRKHLLDEGNDFKIVQTQTTWQKGYTFQ